MATEQVIDHDSPVTRAELQEAIRYHAATAARLPQHYVDKRAAIHKVINNLLDELDHTID